MIPKELKVYKLMASANHENRRASAENRKVHFEVHHDQVVPVIPHQNSGSSTSSDSSMEFDVTAEDAHSSPPLESKKAGDLHPWTLSPELTSPSPCLSIQIGTATQLPELQTMGRPEGYDPDRIPLSIFSSNPTTPAEWSVASNESLFSLHLGNNSFSRDQFILLSEEFPKPDEWATMPMPPVTKAPDFESKNPDMGKHSGSIEMAAEPTKLVTERHLGLIETFHETPKVVLNETPEVKSKEKMDPVEESWISTRSDTSSMST
ncbi:RNA-binding protein with serine-rich domain like [Quillaja saponaria]|uniref:RNA-binding protein with serine-rich domain like n=1 Tax=Quillaja saponaria TaxID=32244 RepID=A0AAD7Q3Z6_QUISA|nr:RNA-binding protein with serine-rich domain like [Quillaja saponaria]